eukprot:m.318084 g.318084  ORF g.318084 m.318084 type:complete len:301 (-) comp27567_c0_seq15:105-1007(-)
MRSTPIGMVSISLSNHVAPQTHPVWPCTCRMQLTCIDFSPSDGTVSDPRTTRWSSGLSPASRTLFYGLRQFFCLGVASNTTRISYIPSPARLTVCSIPDGQYCATCEGPSKPMSTDGAGPTKVDFGLSPVTALSIGTMRGKNMSASFDAALYPFAHFADGALDVVAAGDISDLEFFRRTFCIIFRGRRDDGPEAEYVKATEVHMEYTPTSAPGGKFVINCDGDPRYPKTNRVVVKVLPRAGQLYAYRPLRPRSTGRPLDKQIIDAILDLGDGGMVACVSVWANLRQCLGYRTKPGRMQAL